MCFLNSIRFSKSFRKLGTHVIDIVASRWCDIMILLLTKYNRKKTTFEGAETIWKAKVWHVRRTELVSQEMAPSVGSGTSGHLIELGRPIACSIVIKVLQMTKDKALIQGTRNISHKFIFDEPARNQYGCYMKRK